MASIDAILDRIIERNADRLSLRAGQVPAVLTGDRAVPVQKVPSTAAQILALAKELAPAEESTRIDCAEPCTFRYRDFEVRLTFDSDGPCLDIVATRALAAPEPSEPALTPSGIDLGSAGPARPPLSIVRKPGLDASATAPPAMGPPPAVWQDSPLITRRTALVGAGVLGVAALAFVAWRARPVRLPNAVLADPSGKPVSFNDMRAPHRQLLIVFVMPNCQVSRFAVESIVAAHDKLSRRVSFAAMYFGTTADAQKAREQMSAPFPFFGTKDAKDPFALQEVFKKAGASTLIGASMYGGTTFLLDDDNKVVFKLEKEDVQKLPEKLAKLAE